MAYTYSDFAKDCGVSTLDAVAFVECVRVWTAKGLSLSEAIDRHMAQMNRIAEKSADLARDEEVKAAVVDMFYPAWNGGR